MPLHEDFLKILKAFKKRYGEKPGEQMFWTWIKKLGLNPEKPYRLQQEGLEAFRWAEPRLRLAKQDKKAKYYKVEALFPIISMNRNVYTEDELVKAARTLIGKPVNINHESPPLDGVEIVDAEYEDGAVECLLRVSRNAEYNGRKIVNMIDEGEILHVSIEGECRSSPVQSLDGEVGRGCEGLILTGLALLTKDTLPGVPLTRIMPVEKLVESFNPEEPKEQVTRTCDLCGRVVSDYVLIGNHIVHPGCAKRFWTIFWDIVRFREDLLEVEKMKEQKVKEDAKLEEVKEESGETQNRGRQKIAEKAVPSHETPKAPEDTAWDADAAEARVRKWAGGPDKDKIDWAKYRQAFAWYNAEDPENFGSYKLPHHDVIDGRLVVVWRGVAAAMAVLFGARGGVDIPEADRKAVYTHLARHYRQFDREPPKFGAKAEALEVLIGILEQTIEQQKAKIRELCQAKKQLEDRLKKTKRLSRIIVKL